METGLYHNLDETTYHAHPALSVHLLHEFRRSPAHYQLALAGRGKEATPAMILGRAVHAAVLEPESFGLGWVCGPETRRGKAWDQAEASAHSLDMEILPESEYNRVIAIASAVRAHPAATKLLAESEGDREVSWFAGIDDQHGGTRPARGRCDAICHDLKIIWDLKTCQSANPQDLQRVTLDFRYHVQGAFYVDGLALCGYPDYSWVVVAVESQPPHNVSVIWYPPAWIDAGRLAYQTDLMKLRDCELSGDWSGYGTGVHTLGADGWVAKKMQEDGTWQNLKNKLTPRHSQPSSMDDISI